MSKYNFAVACAFAASAESTYDATLDAIAGTLTSADGLLLGKSGTGIGDSGLTLGLGREYDDKSVESGTLTRPISDFLRMTVPTFTFSFPLCGNRANASTPVVDADCVPLTGMDAILQGAGLVGGAWGSGVGHHYVFGATNLLDALVYVNGMRLELQDCRCSSLAMQFAAGAIPVGISTIAVGTVKDVSQASLPGTLTWNEQASVSAPKITAVANEWKNTRGFSELTITIAQDIADVPDSNATDGIVKELDGRTTTVTGTLFSDDTGSDEIFDADQIEEDTEGNLEELTFEVGDASTDGNPVKAINYSLPLLELHVSNQDKLGSRAATVITGVARGASGAGGNDEFDMVFI